MWLGVFFPKNKSKPIYLREYAEKKLKDLENNSLEDLQDEKKGELLQTAYERLWAINSDEQDKHLQVRTFRLLLCAFRPLTANELREAVSFTLNDLDKEREELKLVDLESLYHNFLTTGLSGFLEFEHSSSKTFVMGLKEAESEDLLFSQPKNHLAMADLAIKAMVRPLHQLWTIDGFRFCHWAAQLRDPEVFRMMQDLASSGQIGVFGKRNDPPASILPELGKVLFGKSRDHFASYLSGNWALHCRKATATNKSIAPRIRSLIQSSSSAFDGWCLTYGVLYNIMCISDNRYPASRFTSGTGYVMSGYEHSPIKYQMMRYEHSPYALSPVEGLAVQPFLKKHGNS